MSQRSQVKLIQMVKLNDVNRINLMIKPCTVKLVDFKKNTPKNTPKNKLDQIASVELFNISSLIKTKDLLSKRVSARKIIKMVKSHDFKMPNKIKLKKTEKKILQKPSNVTIKNVYTTISNSQPESTKLVKSQKIKKVDGKNKKTYGLRSGIKKLNSQNVHKQVQPTRLSINLFDVKSLINKKDFKSQKISAKKHLSMIELKNSKQSAKKTSKVVTQNPSKINSLLYLDGFSSYSPNILRYDRKFDDCLEKNDNSFSEFL